MRARLPCDHRATATCALGSEEQPTFVVAFIVNDAAPVVGAQVQQYLHYLWPALVRGGPDRCEPYKVSREARFRLAHKVNICPVFYETWHEFAEAAETRLEQSVVQVLVYHLEASVCLVLVPPEAMPHGCRARIVERGPRACMPESLHTSTPISLSLLPAAPRANACFEAGEKGGLGSCTCWITAAP